MNVLLTNEVSDKSVVTSESESPSEFNTQDGTSTLQPLTKKEFANFSEARNSRGSKTNSGCSPSVKISHENGEEEIDDPEAFFARSAKARNRRGSKNSESNSNVSSGVKISYESGEEATEDLEAAFPNISKARESSGRKNSELNSDGSSKVNSDEEPIDDPEVFFANIFKTQERSESNIYKAGSDDVLEDRHRNDGAEDLDDSFTAMSKLDQTDFRPTRNQKKKDKVTKPIKESRPNNKSSSTIPRAVKSNLIPEESSSSSSVSSSSQFSINGFEDEYYYDEERAMMDRESLRLSQREFQLSRQEFGITKKMMLVSSCMCFLAFGLLLVFILDPMQKRNLR